MVRTFKIFRFFNNTKNAKVTLEAWESTLKIFQNSIFSIFFNIGTHFMSKQKVWDHFQQNLKFLIFSPKKRLSAWGLGGKISKIFKTRFFNFFQLQNSFHVKTTCLGPFPAKFKIFHIFTKKRLRAWSLGGKNFENF